MMKRTNLHLEDGLRQWVCHLQVYLFNSALRGGKAMIKGIYIEVYAIVTICLAMVTTLIVAVIM
jgi:hypothetical protein